MLNLRDRRRAYCANDAVWENAGTPTNYDKHLPKQKAILIKLETLFFETPKCKLKLKLKTPYKMASYSYYVPETQLQIIAS